MSRLYRMGSCIASLAKQRLLHSRFVDVRLSYEEAIAVCATLRSAISTDHHRLSTIADRIENNIRSAK